MNCTNRLERIKIEWIAILILIFAVFLLFFKLGDRPLWSSDEGRYAEIPREMVESGDYITPHLNYVKYFEKPVLSYWLTAASYNLFGENEFAARFPVALCGFLTILMVYLFGRVVFDSRTSTLSIFILTATTGFFLVSRYLIIDGPFTFFNTASLCLFWIANIRNKGSIFLLSYACMALAVLTKGLIGLVLPGLIIGSYILVARDFSLIKRSRILWGILVFLIVSVPWFLAVSLKNPEFFDFFFIHEHFQRFLTKSAGRHGSIFYFVIIGAMFFFPWTSFVPCALRKCFSKGNTMERNSFIFLNLWWIVVLVFFSFSQSKLPPYIIPIVPPLALVVGNVWKEFIWDGQWKKYIQFGLYFTLVGFVLIAISSITVLGVNYSKDIEARTILPYVIPIGIMFIIASGYLAWFLRSFMSAGNEVKRKIHCLIAIAVPVLIGYIFVIGAMEKLSLTQSRYSFIEEIKKNMDDTTDVAVFDGYEKYSDVGFNLKKRIILVGDIVGELRFGKAIGDNQDYFISLEEFKNICNSNRRVYCLIKKDKYGELLENKVEGLTLLKETPEIYLFINEGSKTLRK
ncbi:MAG: glycosyltransferase family 39 protein [Candidatus Ancaeobacter aquaticus]|nr:glycosyltransferase family 39 protein [Candidatus Ancaeobacter aquaticus]